VFPTVPVLFRVASILPSVVKDVVAEGQAAKQAGSDGGAKVTAEEVAVIVGHVMQKIGEAVLPIVLKANGLA
jgi:hypothetical protein